MESMSLVEAVKVADALGALALADVLEEDGFVELAANVRDFAEVMRKTKSPLVLLMARARLLAQVERHTRG